MTGGRAAGLTHARVEAEVADELARRGEAADVADRRHEGRRRLHVDARDRHQPQHLRPDPGGSSARATASAVASLALPAEDDRQGEAVIKTLLREWAHRFAYPTSQHSSRALPGFLRWCNNRRPHSSLGGRPPISRVSHLCGQYI
jgi:transposase InsO family protein